MMNHIDISSVLRQTLACDLYSNLVTRSTGAAVREQIEQLLEESHEESHERALTVIDFSRVSMIDFSCADEVVAKLLMRYAADNCPREAYFLFRGVTETHSDAIESVLARHGLALALESGGEVAVMGSVTDGERAAWAALYRAGRATALEVADELSIDTNEAQARLDRLCRLRLVMLIDGHYRAVGSSHAWA